MKVAEVLSDLVSLQACDHTAAMNLVAGSSQSQGQGSSSSTATTDVFSSRPDEVESTTPHNLSGLTDEDVKGSTDLQRVFDLLDLHYGVKQKCASEGIGPGLENARREVKRVLADNS